VLSRVLSCYGKPQFFVEADGLAKLHHSNTHMIKTSNFQCIRR
jgi:hypothetical protein